jgi:hypothetical protein
MKMWYMIQSAVPAGKIAFESVTISVVRNEDRNDGCPWGTARLKFDLVAIAEVPTSTLFCSIVS